MMMMMMPAMMAPMAMVPMMMPMTVMVPAHFLRLDAIDIVLRDDSGFGAHRRRDGLQLAGHRRQGRGLRDSDKHGAGSQQAHRRL